MAKLINRYALFDAIRNITYNSKDADAFFEEVLEVITEQPTTTEAEIKAKAIDEFADKIRDWQKEVYTNDRYAGELDFLFKHIYEIAEQLKGE